MAQRTNAGPLTALAFEHSSLCFGRREHNSSDDGSARLEGRRMKREYGEDDP